MECSVRGCNSATTEVFDAGTAETGPLEFLVCGFHGLALRDGAAWTEDGGDLIVTLNELLHWSVTETLGRPRISITVGDAFESRTIEFVADPATLPRLCDVLSKYFPDA